MYVKNKGAGMSLRRKHLKGGDEMMKRLLFCVWFMLDPKGFCLARLSEAEREKIGVKFDA